MISRVWSVAALFSLVWTSNLSAQVSAGNDTTICLGASATLNLTAPCGGDGTTTYSVASTVYSAADSYTTGTNAFTLTTANKFSPLINIGFIFCFYGNSYTQCIIGNNGIVSFALASAGGACPAAIGAGAAIPNAADPLNCIMGPWVRLAMTGVTQIKYQVLGVAPFRRLVVSYNNVPFGGAACSANLAKFQIKLFESTNAIEIHIASKPACAAVNGGRAIEGIQNSTGTAAVSVAGRNCTNWNTTNNAYKFCPSAAAQYTANWYDGATLVGTGNSISVSPTVTTTYIVHVQYTCSNQTATDTMVVNVSHPVPTGMNSTLVSCTANDGTAWPTLPVGGPFTYSWSPTGQTGLTATSLSAFTQYTVTLTDANGCTGTDTITLQQNNPLVATGSGKNISCNGLSDGKAWVTVTAGTPFGYLWSPSAQTGLTATNLAAGIYTCTIGDANGCTITATYTVVDPPLLAVTASPHSVMCNGGNNGSDTAIVTGGTGAYTYAWTPSGGNGATAINLSPGNYTVVVTDANGCTASASSAVTNPSSLAITTSANTTICIGQSATISATVAGGTIPYTYNWSNGGPNGSSQSVSPVVATSYTVTVTDANGCVITSNAITISVHAALTVTPSSAITICAGDSCSISATATGGDGNFTFTWSNGMVGAGPFFVNPNATTSYSVTVSDGCGTPPAIGAVTITVSPAPIVKFITNNNKGCPPLTIDFTDQSSSVSPIVSYSWDFGDGSSTSNSINPTHEFDNSGYFPITLTIVSSNGCATTSYTDSVIRVYPKPHARFLTTPNITTLDNPEILFTDESIGATSTNWDFGDGFSSFHINPYHSYSDTGTFWVTQRVYNDFNCSDSIRGTVMVRLDYVFYIPSAFTPDGNGHNETFQGIGNSIAQYQMDIFDRWGRLVFTTDKFTNPWDGKDCQEGVYVYHIWIRDNTQNDHYYDGRVSLIR